MYKSIVIWPTYMSLECGNNISTNTHSSYKEAVIVCDRLSKQGFGLQGEHFPIRTFILPEQEQFTKEEVDEVLASANYDERIYLNKLFSKNDYMTMDQLVWFLLTKTNGVIDETRN